HHLLYCSAQGMGRRASGVSAGQRRPNKSFEPNPLRYANHMAGKACHVLRSTTRLGLTLVLGGNDRSGGLMKIHTILAVAIAIFMLAACERLPGVVNEAKREVRRSLIDPSSAQFESVYQNSQPGAV